MRCVRIIKTGSVVKVSRLQPGRLFRLKHGLLWFVVCSCCVRIEKGGCE